MFKRRARYSVYHDAWMEIYQDEVTFPDGSLGTYGVVSRKNGAGVVVITPDEKILLLQQYRYPIDRYEWNIPGGGIDANELPETAAMREVLEETGIKLATVEKLTEFYSLSAFSTEKTTIFLAQVQEEPIHLGGEVSEIIKDCRFITLQKALELIDRGETDPLTASAVQIVARRLKK